MASSPTSRGSRSDHSFSSASSMSAVPTSPSGRSAALDVHVTDYYHVGDGSAYDSHIFNIVVKFEEFVYTVDRSYIDFVDLDKRIRKRFPKTSIIALPLDAAAVLEKKLEKVDSSKRRSSTEGRGGLTGMRDSISGISGLDGFSTTFKIKEGRLTENVASKVKPLDNYLTNLLKLHEIVTSDELMHFLDEEAPNMLVSPSSIESLTVYDLLLMNETVHKCRVSSTEEQYFPIQKGQFIIWKFTTSYYDIGFSVEINNEVKLAFSRHNSHERPICGALEANISSTCKLIWDNSYAKLRSKDLYWSCRVVGAEEYQIAKAQALEVQRERRKFEDQRRVLSRVAVTHASVLSGVIQASSLVNEAVNEHAHAEMKRIRELDEQILRYKREIDDYHADFEVIQQEYNEMEAAKAAAEKTSEQIKVSWMFTIDQLEESRREVAAKSSNVTYLMSQNELLKNDNDRITAELERLNSELIELRSRQELVDPAEDKQSSLNKALDQSDSKGLATESDSNTETSESATNIFVKKVADDLDDVAYLNKMEELEKALAVSRSTIATLTSKNADFESKYKNSSDKNIALQDRVSRLLSQLEQPDQVKNFDLISNIGGEGDKDSKIKECETMILNMHKHFNALTLKYSIAVESIDELSKENEDNRKLLSSLENKVVFNQFQTMKSEIKRLEALVAGYRTFATEISNSSQKIEKLDQNFTNNNSSSSSKSKS